MTSEADDKDIGCQFNADNEKILQKLLENTKGVSTNNFTKILCEDIRGFDIPELDKIKSSDKNEKEPLLHLLFDDIQHELPKVPNFLASMNNKIETVPELSSKEEETLLKIKINYTKLRFLASQNYILSRYLFTILDKVDSKIKEEFIQQIPDDISIIDDIDKPGPKLIKELFNILLSKEASKQKEPPSLTEIKFYLDILKRYDKSM